LPKKIHWDAVYVRMYMYIVAKYLIHLIFILTARNIWDDY
jgi:hypothetical protein